MVSKTSAFGLRQYSPIEVLNDDELMPVLQSALLTICKELRLGEPESQYFVDEVWKGEWPQTVLELEERLQHTVSSLVSPQVMREALDRRALLISEQVAPYIVGDSLLDIGSGDGMVSWLLRERVSRIVLTDVHHYLDPRINLQMHNYCQGQPLLVDDTFDTCMLLTVLHHAEDPEGLLCETRRVCRNRAIVIESVYGVPPDPQGNKVISLMDFERQRKYATFIDWLYNRVFHDGVPVPYNFNTPRGWRKLFTAKGWSIFREIDLGIDQPLVPEYHFLFVLETVESSPHEIN